MDPAADWRERARCRTEDPDLFFHPDGERAAARKTRLRRAQGVCAECSVMEHCRDFALSTFEGFGVWGGMSEDDRIALYVGMSRRPRGRSVHLSRLDESALSEPDLSVRMLKSTTLEEK